MDWVSRHTLMHLSYMFGWYPHYQYIQTLYLHIHKIYLMRGGKYCKVEFMNTYGDIETTWITINDLSLLSNDRKRYEDENTFEFLKEDGQLDNDLNVQVDHLLMKGINHNDEIIKFMKEGVVHQPELFEAVMRGYNIDTRDFVINTEDNKRWKEGHKNY